MSNLSRLEAVSDALDTAISTANSLPNAGSGGSIKTCTMTITNNTNAPLQVVYCNGDLNIDDEWVDPGETSVVQAVLRSGYVYIKDIYEIQSLASYITECCSAFEGFQAQVRLFKIEKDAAAAAITFVPDDGPPMPI